MVFRLDTLTTPNPNAVGHSGQRKIAVRSTDGRIYATWDSDTGAVLAFSDDRGDTWSSPVLISGSSDPREASLWADSDGTVHAVYTAVKDGTTDRAVYYRTILANGTLSDQEEVCWVAGYDQANPTAVTNTSTLLMIAWESCGLASSPTVSNIASRGRHATIGYYPTTLLTNASSPQTLPMLAGEPTRIGVYWRSGIDGHWFLRRYSVVTHAWGTNRELDPDSQCGGVSASVVWGGVDDLYWLVFVPPSGTFANCVMGFRHGLATTSSATYYVADGASFGGNCRLPCIERGADGKHCCAFVCGTDLLRVKQIPEEWGAGYLATSDVETLDDSLTSITSVSVAPYNPYALYYNADDDQVRFVDFGVPTLAVALGAESIVLTFGDE